jgi:hypothetical protein
MEKNPAVFAKYFKESGIEKRSGAKAEDVHKGFKVELEKLDKAEKAKLDKK